VVDTCSVPVAWLEEPPPHEAVASATTIEPRMYRPMVFLLRPSIEACDHELRGHTEMPCPRRQIGRIERKKG
jgi:hypothetical protein